MPNACGNDAAFVDQTAGEPTGAPAPGFGAILRKARIAKGLSIADVATETRVSTDFLSALENGRIAADVAPIYAIGFARAYARAVGLAEDMAAGEVRGIIARRTAPAPRPRATKNRFLQAAGMMELWAGFGIVAVWGVVLLLIALRLTGA